MAIWDEVLTERDKQVFAAAGYGKRQGFGNRPAVMVVDAFSYNFKVVIVEECVFDRGQASHKVNLFDMQAKYADVIPLEAALSYLDELPRDRSVPQSPGVEARA